MAPVAVSLKCVSDTSEHCPPANPDLSGMAHWSSSSLPVLAITATISRYTTTAFDRDDFSRSHAIR